jgi:glycosyltransferase involved in cell wall biosynthesis
MKRVMVVTNSLAGGGAERAMNLICNELIKREWQVSLVPINSGITDGVVLKCEVFPLERNWNGTLLNTVGSLWKFNKVVSKWNPEIIILNCDLPELFGSLLLSERKLVVLEHTSKAWAKRSTLGRIIRKILTLRKSIWAAVSNHLTIWPNARKPQVILQNSIILPEKKIEVSSSNQIKRLVFIGRLSQEKRPEFALEIARATNLEVIFIGEGVLKNELRDNALKGSIKANFLGWMDNPWFNVKSGDLLIVPSSLEGDGLTVVEGLAFGAPMLLADIPDLRRFNFPDKQYCATVNDFVLTISKFKNKITELVLDENSSQAILSTRSINVVGDAWTAFLKNA